MRKTTLSGLAILAGIAVADGAGAAPRYRGGPYADGFVHAESRWGHGSVSGPVRRGRNGYQVRLPGGTWVECVRNNCSETLRLQTVDFFETLGTSALDGGPGYLRREWRW